MPLLDVSDIVLDPDFAEQLTIYRRTQNIDAFGISRPISTLVSPAPYGVVLAQDASPLARKEDFQDLEKMIEVHTRFRLRSASVDSMGVAYQPDFVVWKGNEFLVVAVYDFSNFGVGFIRALCNSVDPTDNAPV